LFKDAAAAAAAYPVAVKTANANTTVVLKRFWEGDHAAAFEYDTSGSRYGPVYVYVVQDSNGWHKFDAWVSGAAYPLEPNVSIPLTFHSGCMNVHRDPSLGSQVLSCLASGAKANIDQGPVYADGDIWWHLQTIDTTIAPLGWAVQKYLMCTNLTIDRLPQC
jgi:hypothetical protein